MAAIAIVIVTFNSEAEIGGCLDAALATGAEIIVVDNASADGTLAEVRRRNVRVITNSENRGFAAAANQGFSACDRPYVLLLNPDVVLGSSIEALREACEAEGVAAAGGCLVDSDGRPQIGFMVRKFPTPVDFVLEALLVNRLWPGNPVNRRYRELGLDPAVSCDVEQPAGAMLMARHAAWREIGGFDEGFFPVWFEDVDFCRRLADRGCHLRYVSGVVAKHTGAHSISLLTLEKRRIYWYGSLLRYSAKHFRPTAFRIVCLAVVAGSCMRMIGESAAYRSLKPLAVYGKVVRLASRCFCFGWGEGPVRSSPRN
jgi:N-acetylglucosaminyl-diphospho-decaprenol L-rhamnosyltransferase